MNVDHFITSTGRRINFIPGWFEMKHSWPYGIKDFREYTKRIFDDPGNTYPTGFGFFVNKLITFNYFCQVMEERFTGQRRWPKVLDIGTGPAIQPRLMKGAGLCEESWGIDILDRRHEFTDQQALEYLRELYSTYVTMDNKKMDAISMAVHTYSNIVGNLYPLKDPSRWITDNRSFSLDRYIVDDFLRWQPENEKFDAITAFMCIEYMDASALLKKINSLLTPDGLFFVIVDFWYEASGGSMHLPMDAPWLHARVTRDDLLRYYRTVRPEIADCAEKCIYFANSHMTAADYVESGKKCGMKLLSYGRSMLRSKDNIMLLYKGNNSGFFQHFYSTVLPDAREINPHVTESDFFTEYLTLIFVKDQEVRENE